MLLLRTRAPWLLLLLLLFLGHQVSPSSGARSENRGADESAAPAPGRAQRTGDKPAATGRGKFSVKDEMRCTWGARDVGDTVKLSVKCRNVTLEARAGAGAVTCQYTAKPRVCARYVSDSRGFWKQVARALHRLRGRVCTDERALVKAGMCKRAPRDAHFRLDTVRPVTSAESGGPGTPAPAPPQARATSAAPTACTGRADHRKTAEEHCSSAWASVCAFLFSVLQSDC